MRKMIITGAAAIAVAVFASLDVGSALAQGGIDNAALASPAFREHKRTFGLVYTLPKEVNDTLNATVYGLLREKLLNARFYDEAQRFNIPHVTVLHIHNSDPATPEKMLKALPKLPGEVKLTLKNFYTTEAAKGAGHPWWLDLGIVKEGPGFEAMMAFNTAAVPPLTALRDGPLPRVTGPVYAVMADAGKELVRTVGVSGVNTVKDGKELRPHNPHNTLVYSMAKFTPEVQAAFDQTAREFNQILPDGIPTTFKTVSIVELGFAGNVLREIYRIDLKDGAVLDVATGKTLSR
ncbi:MAG: hypothetical protein ABI831_11890 [Betaproteobacteria bacterium]